VIYFIKNSRNGLIKIGRSDCVSYRIKKLKEAYGRQLILLKCIHGDSQTETKLHKRFRKSRMHGEWFKESKQLRQFIETSKNGRPKKRYVVMYLKLPAELVDAIRDAAKREHRSMSAQLGFVIGWWLKTYGKAGADPNAVKV
jgi:hypothetical protein